MLIYLGRFGAPYFQSHPNSRLLKGLSRLLRAPSPIRYQLKRSATGIGPSTRTNQFPFGVKQLSGYGPIM